MNERLPTKEEWEAWLDQPETRALQAVAKKRREEIKEGWEGGAFDTDQKNFQAVGACKALSMLEELDFVTVIEGELKDD